MAKHLNDDEFLKISEQSGIDECVIKSWYKEFITVCPKGKMDKKHFYKFYKMLRGQSEENLSKITDYVFACFDTDSNGYLDFSEFLIAYSSTTNSDPRKKLDYLFMFYDKDKDGIISSRDFLQVIEAMYEFRKKDKKEYPPEKFVRDIFSRIDDNGDCRLTKDEFIEGCLKNEKMIDLISPFD